MTITFTPLTDDTKRVIYNVLPQAFSEFHHSAGDEIYDSAYLVEYWEQIYLKWGEDLQVFLNYNGDLNVFNDDQLNFLAPFFGFTGEYFSEDWGKQIKIDLFNGVYKDPYIWRFRGSEKVFNYVGQALGIQAYISSDGGFITGINTANDICGRGSLPGEIIVKYPQTYFDDSVERGYLDYLVTHFIPVHIHAELRTFEVTP